MIQLIRIDDRLLHGQVVYSWKASLDYQAIVIADDNAAKDDLRKKVIKMATPPGVKSITLPVAEACEFLTAPTLEKVRVMVVVGSPKSALDILRFLTERPVVNLGGMMMAQGRKQFAKAVYLNSEDAENLEKIVQMGVSIDVRQTPSETSQKYQDLRTKFQSK